MLVTHALVPEVSITTPCGPEPVPTEPRTVIATVSITDSVCPGCWAVPWSAESTVASSGVRYNWTEEANTQAVPKLRTSGRQRLGNVLKTLGIKIDGGLHAHHQSARAMVEVLIAGYAARRG